MVGVLWGDVVGSGLVEFAIRRGGHVRVGLEDYAGPGQPAKAAGWGVPQPTRPKRRRCSGATDAAKHAPEDGITVKG